MEWTRRVLTPKVLQVHRLGIAAGLEEYFSKLYDPVKNFLYSYSPSTAPNVMI